MHQVKQTLACSVLLADGFVVNPYDHCVFNKYAPDGKQITVCFHVDDLMITSVSSKALAEVSFVEGPTHSYLSMHLQKNKEGGWEVNMHSFID